MGVHIGHLRHVRYDGILNQRLEAQFHTRSCNRQHLLGRRLSITFAPRVHS